VGLLRRVPGTPLPEMTLIVAARLPRGRAAGDGSAAASGEVGGG